MEKIFNSLSIVGGTIGGALIGLLGGWDKLITALLIFMCLDYLTGVIKAIYNKDLSSEIGFKGLAKKVLILIIVAVAVIVENTMGVPAIREMVIMFFTINEAISILENAAQMGLPIPEKLKEVLLQLRTKNSNKEEK